MIGFDSEVENRFLSLDIVTGVIKHTSSKFSKSRKLSKSRICQTAKIISQAETKGEISQKIADEYGTSGHLEEISVRSGAVLADNACAGDKPLESEASFAALEV